MKLKTQLLKIEDSLTVAAEARNITPPVRQALRHAIDAVITAQRELADTMYPFAVDYATGRLYKADEHGKYHPIPK